jgi:lipid A 3-O-deacylase
MKLTGAVWGLLGALVVCGAAAGQSAGPATLGATTSGAASAASAAGDDFAGQTIKKGTWELGLLGGGGEGLGKSDNTQFAFAGGRVGYVLTGEHLPGWLRGNFQWTVDMMPVLTVFPASGAIYGGGFKPVIWQWNFTSHRKFVPYFSADGGILFTTHNVPPGNTSYVNFMPGASFGAHIFTRRGRAVFFQVSAVHISSASLGTQNPGYNGSLFFTVGYSWFKTRGR